MILTTPNFWFRILLILLLSLGLKWFPVAGFGATFQDHTWYLFLPTLTLALQFSAGLIRNVRGRDFVLVVAIMAVLCTGIVNLSIAFGVGPGAASCSGLR